MATPTSVHGPGGVRGAQSSKPQPSHRQVALSNQGGAGRDSRTSDPEKSDLHLCAGHRACASRPGASNKVVALRPPSRAYKDNAMIVGDEPGWCQEISGLVPARLGGNWRSQWALRRCCPPRRDGKRETHGWSGLGGRMDGSNCRHDASGESRPAASTPAGNRRMLRNDHRGCERIAPWPRGHARREDRSCGAPGGVTWQWPKTIEHPTAKLHSCRAPLDRATHSVRR